MKTIGDFVFLTTLIILGAPGFANSGADENSAEYSSAPDAVLKPISKTKTKAGTKNNAGSMQVKAPAGDSNNSSSRGPVKNAAPKSTTFTPPPPAKSVKVEFVQTLPAWRQPAGKVNGFFKNYRSPQEAPETNTSPKFDVRPLGWSAAGAQSQVTYGNGVTQSLAKGFAPVKGKSFKGSGVNPDQRGAEDTEDCGVRCTHDKASETISFNEKFNDNQILIWETLLAAGEEAQVIREMGDHCIVEEQKQMPKDADYAKQCLERTKDINKGLFKEYAAVAIAQNNAMVAQLNTDSGPAAGTGSDDLHAVQFERTGFDKKHAQTTYILTGADLEAEDNQRMNRNTVTMVSGSGGFTSGDMAAWAKAEVQEAALQQGRHLGDFFTQKYQNKADLTVTKIPGTTLAPGAKAAQAGDRKQITAKSSDLAAKGKDLADAFINAGKSGQNQQVNAKPKQFARKQLSGYDWLAFRMTREAFITTIEGKQITKTGRRTVSSQSAQVTGNSNPQTQMNAQMMKSEARKLNDAQVRKADALLTQQADQRGAVYTVTMDPSDLRREAEAELQ